MNFFYFWLISSFFLTMFSVTISAQSVRDIESFLNRLSPEQRMKVEGYRSILSSKNRKVRDVSNYEGKSSAMDTFTQKGSETNDAFSVDSGSESENEKDSLLLLLEFEKTLTQDLERINESLELAKENLGFEEFQNVEVELNYQMFDIKKLLEEVRSLKLQELKSSIGEINKGPESDLKTFGYELFNRKSDFYFANDMNTIPSNYNIGPGDSLETMRRRSSACSLGT